MGDSAGDVSVGMDVANIERHGGEVVIGGIGRRFEAEGQCAGPASETCPLPSADEGVDDAAGVAERRFTTADGKRIDPVGGDHAAGVKV